MEKEVRFRILNKTSKTVTVKLGKPMTFSWEEFNKKLVVVDKFWSVLNEEEKKKQEEADELVNDAVICVMFQRGNGDPIRKLAYMAQLGEITTKLQEMLECDNAMVIDIIRKRLMLMNPFMVNPMFDDETLKRNHMYRKKNPLFTEDEEESQKEYEDESDAMNRPIVNEKGQKGHQYGPEKPTLGDAFSCLGELKKKMENK